MRELLEPNHSATGQTSPDLLGHSQRLYSMTGYAGLTGAPANNTIRDFSNDLGTGIVVMPDNNSQSYIGAELMEFLGPRSNGTGNRHTRHGEDDSRSGVSPLLDQAVISFNHLMRGGSDDQSNQLHSHSSPRRPFTYSQEQPPLFIKIKEENENLKVRVDQLELELAEEVKKVTDLERRKERLHAKLEQKDKSISKLRDNLKTLRDDI